MAVGDISGNSLQLALRGEASSSASSSADSQLTGGTINKGAGGGFSLSTGAIIGIGVAVVAVFYLKGR